MANIPSVGRIVHYVSYGTPGGEYKSACRAAIITEVSEEPEVDQAAAICVVNPTGQFFRQGCPHDENKAEGTWHWPEYVASGSVAMSPVTTNYTTSHVPSFTTSAASSQVHTTNVIWSGFPDGTHP